MTFRAGIVKGLLNERGITATAFLKHDRRVKGVSTRAAASALIRHTQTATAGWAFVLRQDDFEVVFSRPHLEASDAGEDASHASNQKVSDLPVSHTEIKNPLLCALSLHPVHLRRALRHPVSLRTNRYFLVMPIIESTSSSRLHLAISAINLFNALTVPVFSLIN